jgi:restriction system protein
VLDLLHCMGYGASREDLQHVGGLDDGSVDGVIPSTGLDGKSLRTIETQAGHGGPTRSSGIL